MPRYFFDIHDNGDITVDETGLLFASMKLMRDEAIRTLPAIASDELPDGPSHSFWVRVRDESGDYVFEASLELKTHWINKGGPE